MKKLEKKHLPTDTKEYINNVPVKVPVTEDKTEK